MYESRLSVPNQNSPGTAISSPIASGGAGVFFEQHVDALFLALLLVRGFPPIIKDCQINAVQFQAEVDGWHTDDVLVSGQMGDGTQRRMAAQIKRKFIISTANEDCVKAILDFWDDFTDSERFNRRVDKLVLIVLRGTDTLLSNFNSLLDCARSAPDAAKFQERLAAPRYLSTTSRQQAASIRSIVDKRGPISVEDFWEFLKVLHILSFDLNTATSQNEAWIKLLLAQTSKGPEPASLAEASWRELLELVSEGMPRGARFTRDDLPSSLRIRHSEVPSIFRASMTALTDHTNTTLFGIRTNIAHKVVLPRDQQVMEALAALDTSQILLISGEPGSGKSVVAKLIVEAIQQDEFYLEFRAEEFATSHIDNTFAFADTTGERFFAMLAGQDTKTILIDSIERLLEASVRDAFSDILRLLQRDHSLRLILTCRDYSLETVKSSFLEAVGLSYKALVIPPLTDDDLSFVASSIPELRHPLELPVLKELLKLPYYLDLASRVDWMLGSPPDSEREFRLRCWNDVVRRNDQSGEGMPTHREQAFIDIAVQRARELRPYIRANSPNIQALERLKQDGLVAEQADLPSLVAPAHDVLEDWAIIRWLDGIYATDEGSIAAISAAVGAAPAIRRSYRKWLGELLFSAPTNAKTLVEEALKGGEVEAYFRDDTLIAMLLSPCSHPFLEECVEELCADGGVLLARIIHLLRVACKIPALPFPVDSQISHAFFEPVGNAWVPILRIIDQHYSRVSNSSNPLILGLLEDWVGVLGLPKGGEGFIAAGRIAFRLLENAPRSSHNGFTQRLFNVIARIPGANRHAFRELLDRGCRAGRDDPIAAEFTQFILSGNACGQACREFPDEMVRLTIAYSCLNEPPRDSYSDSPSDMEGFFGLRPHTDFHFFPASAWRGPFLPLLQSHPNAGLNLILDLVNHAGSWYGEERFPRFRLESAEEITLLLPDETIVNQWSNQRLWQAYRCTSVAPDLLECALMALESWLLQHCKSEEFNAESWLLAILRRSNNVMLTAVVASICIAFSEKAGAAAIALLKSEEVIWMDRNRMVADQTQTTISDAFPLSPPDHKLYESERKTADGLEHRRRDIEDMALRLQFTPQRDAVWKLLDAHQRALPPLDLQERRHQLWRLSLHRMDIRGYAPVNEVNVASNDGGSAEEHEPSNENQGSEDTYFVPSRIEGDIQEIITQNAERQVDLNEDLSLLNWGYSTMFSRSGTTADPAFWQEMLEKSQQRLLDLREPEGYARGGPSFIAAACIRDHWVDMDEGNRRWCIGLLIGEVKRHCNVDDRSIYRASSTSLDSDRAAAYVLPRAMIDESSGTLNQDVFEAVATALTHSVVEVAQYAAQGVGFYSQGIWDDLAYQYAAALAKGAMIHAEMDAAQREKPYNEWRDWHAIEREADGAAREFAINRGLDPNSELEQLDLNETQGQLAARKILYILSNSTTGVLSKRFHRLIAESLVRSWKSEEDYSSRRTRHFEYEYACREQLSNFALRSTPVDALHICEPFLDGVNTNPKEAAELLDSITYRANDISHAPTYWNIWQAFADKCVRAPWTQRISSQYPKGIELIRALFLNIAWKPEATHWPFLDNNSRRLDSLLKTLPHATQVLAAYTKFLFNIGEKSLPAAFISVEYCLRNGDSVAILSNADSKFVLERLLRVFVYGKPLTLKSDPSLRSAVLFILDELVEAVKRRVEESQITACRSEPFGPCLVVCRRGFRRVYFTSLLAGLSAVSTSASAPFRLPACPASRLSFMR